LLLYWFFHFSSRQGLPIHNNIYNTNNTICNINIFNCTKKNIFIIQIIIFLIILLLIIIKNIFIRQIIIFLTIIIIVIIFFFIFLLCRVYRSSRVHGPLNPRAVKIELGYRVCTQRVGLQTPGSRGWPAQPGTAARRAGLPPVPKAGQTKRQIAAA
jgi:energy-coupling factor transporter transmembrane protein EcfT